MQTVLPDASFLIIAWGSSERMSRTALQPQHLGLEAGEAIGVERDAGGFGGEADGDAAGGSAGLDELVAAQHHVVGVALYVHGVARALAAAVDHLVLFHEVPVGTT